MTRRTSERKGAWARHRAGRKRSHGLIRTKTPQPAVRLQPDPNLTAHPAAVNRQDGAADVIGSRGRQIHHRARQILAGSPHRPAGIRRQDRRISAPGPLRSATVLSVEIYPGAMAFTCTFRPAHSLASALVNCATPPFAAAYPGTVMPPLKAEGGCREHVLPAPRASISRPNSRATTNCAVASTFHHLVPIFVRVFGGGLAQNRAAIVHQNIHRRAFGAAPFPTSPYTAARSARSPAKPQKKRPIARPLASPTASGSPRFLQRGARSDDIGAGFGERHRHGQADAAAGAGDQAVLPSNLNRSRCAASSPKPRSS